MSHHQVTKSVLKIWSALKRVRSAREETQRTSRSHRLPSKFKSLELLLKSATRRNSYTGTASMRLQSAAPRPPRHYRTSARLLPLESLARGCSGSRFFCVPGHAVRGRSSHAPSPARPSFDPDHALPFVLSPHFRQVGRHKRHGDHNQRPKRSNKQNI